MNQYFIYCRKSTEDQGRQILSIESQLLELKKLAESLNLPVIEVFTEAMSAKAPGRPIFNQLIKRIEKGEANGIISWKLDRLSRNPLDSGRINWLLQQGQIKHIQTIDRSFYSQDNVLPMDVELSMATQYIRDLSSNVKRGLKVKIEKGWMPGKAPCGYLNNVFKEKGKKDIKIDPQRFNLVRKMWDLLLTGTYTPPRILDIVNNDWGFRTKKSKRSGGKPLSLSGIYRIFSNPFYAGYMRYNGQIGKGSHRPMITMSEFDQAQKILGRGTSPKPIGHHFAFTGMIKCGECGCSITAEHKEKKNKGNGKIHRYIYYHCTKKKRHIKCSQPALEVKVLERQIAQSLFDIQISLNIKNWALEYLKEMQTQEETDTKERKNSLIMACQKLGKQLENLTLMRTKDLIEDEEYLKQKQALFKENACLEENLKNICNESAVSMELTAQTFIFACYARFWFENGSPEDKKTILDILGSNLLLKDKNLIIEAKKPFVLIKDHFTGVCQEEQRLEPLFFGPVERKIPVLVNHVFGLSRLVDDVRTYWRESIKSGNDWISFKYNMKKLLKSQKASTN